MSYYGRSSESRGRDHFDNSGSRDRSRSRDDGRRGSGGDRYQGYGRGGGGYQGRGRGGYGGGRGRPQVPRGDSVMIKTNFIPVDVTDRGQVESSEWVQYYVTILAAKRVRKRDPTTGIEIVPKELEVIPKGRREGEKTLNLEKGSNELSRRILCKLCKQEHEKDSTFYFVSDGSQTAYAPRRLFTSSSPPIKYAPGNRQNDKTGNSTGGIYGPADNNGPPEPVVSESSISRIYEVSVKTDCEEDDENADRVRNAWFIIRFMEVGCIPASRVRNLAQIQQHEINVADQIRQAIDIMLKSTMRNVGLMALGRSPKAFYFPENKQETFLSRKLQEMFRDGRNTFAPFLGLSNTSRLCEGGKLFINTDVVVDFMDRGFHPNFGGKKKPISLLEVDRGNVSIAGVKIRDPHRKITDDRVKEDILKAIKKLKFHVIYKRRSSPEFIQRKKQEGFTEKEIDRMNLIIFHHLSMRPNANNDQLIYWSADDPKEYSFQIQPRRNKNSNEEEIKEEEVRTVTVAQYYYETYGIELHYPKMPLISAGRKGYFPIEFLVQAFGKQFGANSPDHVHGVLSHFDEFAGTACVDKIVEMQHTAQKMSSLGMNYDDVLRLFNLKIHHEPPSLKAKLLPEPQLRFKGERTNINNGSWNLRGAHFSKPADLNSFAIISFGDTRAALTYVKNLLRVAQSHGISLPCGFDYSQNLDSVLVEADSRSPESVHTAFSNAINKSKRVFINDEQKIYSSKNVWFKSYAQNPYGGISECLVIRPPFMEMNEFGLILRPNELLATHIVINPADGSEHEARLMVEVSIEGKSTIILDPFNFKAGESGYLGYNDQQNQWLPVSFRSFKYNLITDNSLGLSLSINEVCENPLPKIRVPGDDIECPSIVFCCFREKETEIYNFVKCMSHYFFGVQSQCVSLQNFSRQRNPDQFCSNIALKMNAKLMNMCNKARAWSTSFKSITTSDYVPDIPWVSEVPTIVMGIGFSHGFGQTALSVVGGTVCLDPGCMQFAHDIKIISKCEAIPASVLEDMVMNLVDQFKLHNNGLEPVRVLFFRDGLSDGCFDRVRRQELPCIRQAFFNIHKRDAHEGWRCDNEDDCKTKGCIFCTPLITYIASQTQHSIRVVPDQPGPNPKDKNVPSGTCLDHTIMDLKNGMQLTTDITAEGMPSPKNLVLVTGSASLQGFDFLLTAQGGLKGTSKPVYYRTIYNENNVWKPNDGSSTPLTKDILEKLVYHMSYQYGSATKAVRSIPVLHYSKKLAGMVIGYLNYLRGGRGSLPDQVERALESVTLEDDFDDMENSRSDRDRSDSETLIRTEMKTVTLPSYVKTTLFPKFSPYKITKDENGRSQTKKQCPYRLHMSA